MVSFFAYCRGRPVCLPESNAARTVSSRRSLRRGISCILRLLILPHSVGADRRVCPKAIVRVILKERLRLKDPESISLSVCYSVVLNLYAFNVYFACSLSCLTFHRVKSNKSARHRQNKAQQPFARAVYEHSVGCCLPLTAYRSSIGGKRTRFPRTNSNSKNTAQTPFALFPMLERLFAVI